MIQAIVRRMQREGLTNVVTPVLGDYDDPSLPPNAQTDAVLIVDAFHEMEHPVVMLRNVARTLKPRGRIGIIDYREGEGGPGPPPEERVAPSVVIVAGGGRGLEARGPAEVSAVPVFPHLRQVADLDADDAHDRRQRFDRRRRHSGRPENVCGARGVWRLGGHGHHSAKHRGGRPTSSRSPRNWCARRLKRWPAMPTSRPSRRECSPRATSLEWSPKASGRFQHPNLVVDPVMAAHPGPQANPAGARGRLNIEDAPAAARHDRDAQCGRGGGALWRPDRLARAARATRRRASSSLGRRLSSSRVAI